MKYKKKLSPEFNIPVSNSRFIHDKFAFKKSSIGHVKFNGQRQHYNKFLLFSNSTNSCPKLNFLVATLIAINATLIERLIPDFDKSSREDEGLSEVPGANFQSGL